MAGRDVDRPTRAPCTFFARGRCTRGASCPFVHEVGPAPKPIKPCHYFAAGHCAHGNSCRFAHSRDRVVAAEALPPKTEVCRYFAAGRCTKGEECRFAHVNRAGAQNKPTPEDPRKRVPCHFFAVGGCRNGDACPFLHDLALQVEEELDPVAEAARFCLETDDLVDDWIRVIDGAVVKFGDGASVQTISLASDFSAIRLDNLPSGSTATSVAGALRKLGVRVQEEDVKVRPGVVGANDSADIKVEDPSFAARVRERLAAGDSRLRAARIDVPMPTGSSLHRVDCRRVLCSWHSPRRTVWLNFAKGDKALDAFFYLQASKIRIQDRLVVPGAPTGPRFGCWSLRLPDMSPAVDERDFREALPRGMRPDRVSLARPTYDTEVDEVAGMVEGMLRNVGPLESWCVMTASQRGNRIKAQARFESEADAKRAAERLNGRALPMMDGADGKPCDDIELAVQHVPVAVIKVPRRNYATLKAVVDRQCEIWAGMSGGAVHIAAYPSTHVHVVLRLQGSDTRMVAEAHAVLSEIFKGIELEVSKSAWNTVIQNHAWWRGISQRIRQDFGVTVVRDRRGSRLRVFGETAGYELTRQKIVYEVEKCLAEARVIELDDNAYSWACWGGGFKWLVARMGRDKLAMDTTSTPKRILCLGGSESDYKAVWDIVYAGNTSSSSSSSSDDNTRSVAPPPSHTDNPIPDCCVCWTEVEDAVTTPCGHVYCAGCFVGLCCAEEAPADANNTGSLQITCVGDGDTCKKALPLPALKEHLSSAQFEKALQDAFALHVRQHPHDFRFCPTPDCGSVYRVHHARARAEPGVFTCPACIQSTCTACHGAAHQGYTCAEFRDQGAGGQEALARAKAELGVHDCPRCKTLIEKTEGCNHVTCSCGAHICWKCLAVFGTPDQCYAHLNESHGGFFDVPPDSDDSDGPDPEDRDYEIFD
ncbi:hypothetical protein GGTG_13212 [Gaeumannomyces tritici R3-111a-1]|uniref:Ariadne RING finger n=1 Tax=Gaeumannomyces tritici (strain R3-111a-1) TaxID=644352 RepID=J3PI84_GAET3|nr:hypothetical protein GGTG_13212 [Gaeumannomyces tritici R3-111a-1]EJT69596.1 hypothetical protein GGTG_13212 [Gaeumannomyces tritici R3-111a-1]